VVITTYKVDIFMENIFGKNLKRHRVAKGFSVKYLAEKFGITSQSVEKWEKGETMPTGKKIPVIAEILGVTPNQLLESEAVMDKLREAEEREKGYLKQIEELRSELIIYQKKEILELKEQVF
jgi:transcriptional regulator with XRE-family HTH domain